MKRKRISRIAIMMTAMLLLSTACSKEPSDEEVKTEIAQQTSVTQKAQESDVASETQSAAEENVSEADSSVYDSTLQAIYDALVGSDEDKMLDMEGMTGLAESSRYTTVNNALNNAGYAIRDVNNDGTPELVIASVNNRDGNKCYGSSIYSLYTYANEKVVCLLDGYARNRYDLFEDGTVYNSGSGGAIYYVSATYELLPGGDSLKCKECYFTHERNDNYEDVAVYRNTTGSFETSESEETDMTIEAFFEYTEELDKQAISLELIPFAQYENAKPLDLVDFRNDKITEDIFCAAAYLGYQEGGYDELVQYLSTEGYLYKYPFLADIKSDHIILDEGGEWYMLLPVKDNTTIKINQAELDESDYSIKEGKELYQGADNKPVLVRGNVSEIMPAFLVTISEAGGESCTYSPALSMMDGTLQISESVVDITAYEALENMMFRITADPTAPEYEFYADYTYIVTTDSNAAQTETVLFTSLKDNMNVWIEHIGWNDDGTDYLIEQLEEYTVFKGDTFFINGVMDEYQPQIRVTAAYTENDGTERIAVWYGYAAEDGTYYTEYVTNSLLFE